MMHRSNVKKTQNVFLVVSSPKPHTCVCPPTIILYISLHTGSLTLDARLSCGFRHTQSGIHRMRDFMLSLCTSYPLDRCVPPTPS